MSPVRSRIVYSPSGEKNQFLFYPPLRPVPSVTPALSELIRINKTVVQSTSVYWSPTMCSALLQIVWEIYTWLRYGPYPSRVYNVLVKLVTYTWKDNYPSKIVNNKHQRVIFLHWGLEDGGVGEGRSGQRRLSEGGGAQWLLQAWGRLG